MAVLGTRTHCVQGRPERSRKKHEAYEFTRCCSLSFILFSLIPAGQPPQLLLQPDQIPKWPTRLAREQI